MHYYQFNIKEHALASYHLNNEEDLAFRRLKDMYHDTEKPIPLDTDSVARRLRMETQWVLNVLKDFFFREEDGWHIAEIDAEIARYQSNAAKNKANGAKGGRPRRKKEPKENPVGYESHPIGNPKPTTINQQPLTNNQDIHTSRQVEICRMAKKARMYGVNPSHLKLAELSDKHGGYPSDAIWDHAFAIAHDQGGGQFAYAITTAFGEWQKSISRAANKPVARKNTPYAGGGSNPYEIKPEGVKFVGRGIEKFEQTEEEVA